MCKPINFFLRAFLINLAKNTLGSNKNQIIIQFNSSTDVSVVKWLLHADISMVSRTGKREGVIFFCANFAVRNKVVQCGKNDFFLARRVD